MGVVDSLFFSKVAVYLFYRIRQTTASGSKAAITPKVKKGAWEKDQTNQITKTLKATSRRSF